MKRAIKAISACLAAFFGVKSVDAWYNSLRALYNGIDSDGRIKGTFEEHGVTL